MGLIPKVPQRVIEQLTKDCFPALTPRLWRRARKQTFTSFPTHSSKCKYHPVRASFLINCNIYLRYQIQPKKTKKMPNLLSTCGHITGIYSFFWQLSLDLLFADQECSISSGQLVWVERRRTLGSLSCVSLSESII